MTESLVKYDTKQVQLLSRTIAKDCSRDELALFIGQCKRTGLDPFSRQIYCVKIDGRMSIMASIDGLRVVAQRSGQYAGQVGPFWCGPDGQWVDVWLADEPPAAAKVGVRRADFPDPLWSVARFADYSTGRALWKRMPAVMIAKCAEANALRRAFPNDLSGLYASEEMDQAGGGASPTTPPLPPPAGSASVSNAAMVEGPDAPGEDEPTPKADWSETPAWPEADNVYLIQGIALKKKGEKNGKPWEIYTVTLVDRHGELLKADRFGMTDPLRHAHEKQLFITPMLEDPPQPGWAPKLADWEPWHPTLPELSDADVGF